MAEEVGNYKHKIRQKFVPPREVLYSIGNFKATLVQRMKIAEMPEILTLRQASEVLNCHPNTLRNWEREGVIECIRLGKRGDRRFRKEDILKILDKQEQL